ncbi:hypothetical protein P692DRAFT_20161651 [Suillus brevipes Sb2]|nr:hypothetical protein P692DRAFT_20161651 [Suillus brevipes Sb2]
MFIPDCFYKSTHQLSCVLLPLTLSPPSCRPFIVFLHCCIPVPFSGSAMCTCSTRVASPSDLEKRSARPHL